MSSASDPAIDAVAVVTDVDIVGAPRGLYIGAGGDLVVVTSLGNTRTFVAVPTGSVLPIRVRRVVASGTTAASILALY